MRGTKKALMNIGALGGLALLLSMPAAAYQQLDTIVAVVEEDVVLASELLSRIDSVKKQMAAADVEPPPNDVLINQLMERLIVESIQLQDAARRGVEIDDETLTAAVRTFAGQNNMNIDQFRQALAQDGLSYREFREEIRREMIIGRLQRNMVNRRITISDHEIDAVLELWPSTLGPGELELLSTGEIEPLGDLGVDVGEGTLL